MPSFRPRTTEDDVRSIQRLKPVAVGGAIPLPTQIPIVSWDRPVSDNDNKKEPEIQAEGGVLNCLSWPCSTSTLCHHCCYSFDGVPVPLPQSYDALRKVYHCRGNFCSWQCAKAYNNRQTPPAGRGNRNMYIAILAHRTWIKYRRKTLTRQEQEAMRTYATYCIQPSPPREVLQVFGGNMTIEEYRKDLFGIIPPSEARVGKPFLTIRQRLLLPFVVESKSITKSAKPVTQKIDTSTAHKYSNAFCERLNRAQHGKSDQTIVKRKREKDSKNTLFNTMGVVIETKKR